MTTDTPTIHDEPPGQAEKRDRRREAASKAAATRRARRLAEKVDQALAESMDRVAAHVAETRTKATALAAQVAADPPGTPTLAELIRLARDNAAEPTLYRLAHEARAPWKPSQWSAETRTRLATALAASLTARKTSNPKTIPTPKAKG